MRKLCLVVAVVFTRPYHHPLAFHSPIDSPVPVLKYSLRWPPGGGLLRVLVGTLALVAVLSSVDAQVPSGEEANSAAEPDARQSSTDLQSGNSNSESNSEPTGRENTTEVKPGDSTSSGVPVSPLVSQLSGKLEEVGPDTFFLPDADGNPQPVLNMSIEEFVAAWKLQQALADTNSDSSSKYTLDECSVVGTLESNFATLTANFVVRLHTDEAIQVPLGFSGTVLRKLPQTPPSQTSPKTAGRFLQRDSERGGYSVSLKGKPTDVVEIELELWAPIRREGDRASLRLLTPRGNTNTLLLVSKDSVNSVSANEGALLSSRSLAAGGSRIETQHNGGELTLRWQDTRQATSQFDSVLTAKGKIFATLDGDSLRTQAQLTVQSFGRPFSEFVVRLPAGAELIPSQLPDEVESIEPVGVIDTADGVTEVQVTLKGEQLNPVTLNLETKHPLPASGSVVDIELAGFEVVGAVSQNGELGIQIDDGWQLRPGQSESVKQVDTRDIDLNWQSPSVSPESIDLALHYVRQPWSLPIQLVPRQQRAVATPTYELRIGPTEALLEMRVQYQVSGVGNNDYRFAPAWVLSGWDEQKTETRGLRDLEGLVRKQYSSTGTQQPDTPLEYGGFVKGFATRDNPEVTVYLRKSLPPDEARFALTLPYPDQPDLAINSSDLVVVADSSVLINPDPSAHVGLNVEPIVDAEDAMLNRPPGQQFRYTGFQPKVKFAAKKQKRPQRVFSSSSAVVQVSAEGIAIQQDFEFDVRHQPASSIALAGPRNLPIELELLSNDDASEIGTELEIEGRDALEAEVGPMMPEFNVPLPHPRMGKFRVRAVYTLPPPAPTSTSVLKLLSSPGTEFQGHRVMLKSSLTESLTPAAGSNWQIEPTTDALDTGGAVLLTTEQPTTFLPLSYSGRIPASETLEVEKIWVQTWLTVGGFQQRTVLRYRGEGPVRIELPSDLPSGETIEVRIDGRATANVVSANGSINVSRPLPVASQNQPSNEHTLELRYRVADSLGWVNSISVDRPRLVGDESGATLYWQIVAPIQQAYFSSSQELVTAFETGWTSAGWSAQPALDTNALENWIGTSTFPKPTAAEHMLLLRGWTDTPLQVTLVRREVLVLATSATVLAVCLAIIYLPWLRSAPLLISGLAVVAAIALAIPQVAVLVSQLGLLGGMCGLVAALLYLLIQRSNIPNVSSASSADTSGSHRGSTMVPIYSGPISSNAPTVSMEMTDSNA